MTIERCAVCGNNEQISVQLTKAQEDARQNVPEVLPYKCCARCGLWSQFPTPPFLFEADDEKNTRKKSILEEVDHFEWLANFLFKEYHPKSVLDVGSSYPLLLSKLRQKGVPSILGVDGCELAITYGDELNVPIVKEEFLAHDFGPRQFDMLCMVHVLAHFCEPVLAVLKMKRLLKKNGVIFIRTSLNDTDGLTRWHLTKNHFQLHPIIFGQRSLKMLFELAGLQLVYEAVGNGVGHGDYAFKGH